MTASKTWYYTALSLLALVFYGWGLWGQKDLAALPPEFAGVKGTLNSTYSGDSPEEFAFLIQAFRAGDTVFLSRSFRAGIQDLTEVALVHALPLRHFLLTVFSACFFWLVSVIFFAPRVHEAPARDFFLSTLLYGLAVALGGVTYTGPPVWPRFTLSLLQIVCLAILPVVFVHLSLAFPRRHPVLDRRPWLIRALFALAVVVIVLQAAAYLRYLDAPDAGLWAAVNATLLFGDGIIVLEVGAAVLLLFYNSRRSELDREQKQARWLLAGFLVGVTPYVFLRTLPSLFGIGSPLPAEFDRLFELAIPAAFVLAVARHRLLDIDVIIRRGLIYAALTAALVALYLLFGLSIGRLLTRSFPDVAPIVDIGVVIVAVAAYQPLRRRIGRWIDRIFFKIRYSHSRALAAIGRRLDACSSQVDVAETVHAFLNRTLEPKSAAVLLRSRQDVVTAGSWNGRSPEEGLEIASRAVASPRPAAALQRTSLPEIERADFPRELIEEGYWVVQPVTAGGLVLGAILLGEKKSERRYVELDLKLLKSLGMRIGKTIEHLDLIQTAAAEALERNRLDALNRMKTDFLSRVSHDLRTPLASIRWSSENLKDGVAGSMTGPQEEYVDAIRASARQLGRLVESLLDLSRTELDADRIALEPIDAASLIREGVTALGPLAGASRVTFNVTVERDLPPLRGNPAKFMEIVTNLLENAVKFAPPDTSVDVELAGGGPGHQMLTVRDRGPGVPIAEREAIFERFKQGQSPGRGPAGGYGLGLFVVKSTIELFGGTVTVTDHPERGALFTCTFLTAREGGSSS